MVGKLAPKSHRGRVVRLTLAIIVGLSLASLLGRQALLHPSPAMGQAVVSVNVSSQSLGTIPTGFAGLSIEESDACKLVGTDAAHPELDTFLRNLSPFVLRIGGNSSDNSTWVPNAPCSGTDFTTTIGQATIDGIFALARKDNFRVIWGVNLKANDPATFANEAAYAARAGGANLYGIEIGNEPDLYQGIDYPTYRARWEAYYSAIKSLAPGVGIVSPDTAYPIRCATCESTDFFGEFMRR